MILLFVGRFSILRDTRRKLNGNVDADSSVSIINFLALYTGNFPIDRFVHLLDWFSRLSVSNAQNGNFFRINILYWAFYLFSFAS